MHQKLLSKSATSGVESTQTWANVKAHPLPMSLSVRCIQWGVHVYPNTFEVPGDECMGCVGWLQAEQLVQACRKRLYEAETNQVNEAGNGDKVNDIEPIKIVQEI